MLPASRVSDKIEPNPGDTIRAGIVVQPLLKKLQTTSTPLKMGRADTSILSREFPATAHNRHGIRKIFPWLPAAKNIQGEIDFELSFRKKMNYFRIRPDKNCRHLGFFKPGGQIDAPVPRRTGDTIQSNYPIPCKRQHRRKKNQETQKIASKKYHAAPQPHPVATCSNPATLKGFQ